MKRYPLGIQDFAKLRTGGYVYVDKTEQIYNLIRSGSYNFFARPRRFGKSLLVSTIKELYSGQSELFQGLWIKDHWDFAARQRPVIWLRFASMNYRDLGLEKALWAEVKSIGVKNNLILPGTSLPDDFSSLIRTLADSGQVVILIDEYDKAIIDYLDEPEKVAENRAVLKNFYSVLKDNDADIEFLFITGVAAFTKVSIFSDLNHVSNITLRPIGYTLTGITETELNHYFAEEMSEEDPELVRKWYNGYSWGGPERVYNPFSLLSFLRDRIYENYWFETDTPTFLVKLMREERMYLEKSVSASSARLMHFDPLRLDALAVLFQTGYLTVQSKSEGGRRFELDYPNLEVRESFDQMLLSAYLDQTMRGGEVQVFKLRDAFRDANLEKVIRTINATFADLPYEFWKRDDEHFFHAIIHLLFRLVGVVVQSEVHTFRGRCDALVQTDTHVYAFEFKRDASVAEALAQIKERGYLSPFENDARTVLAVGINFDSEARQVADWKAVEVG